MMRSTGRPNCPIRAFHLHGGGRLAAARRSRGKGGGATGEMCGRVIQASSPSLLSLKIVDGMDDRDNRWSNVPPRYNGAPSQDLWVIRRNPAPGERSLDLLRWGLVP